MSVVSHPLCDTLSGKTVPAHSSTGELSFTSSRNWQVTHKIKNSSVRPNYFAMGILLAATCLQAELKPAVAAPADLATAATGYTPITQDVNNTWAFTYYVDPNMATNGNGTSGSPFNSLGNAKSTVYSKLSAGQSVKVILRAGAYTENQDWGWLNPTDANFISTPLCIEGDTTKPGQIVFSGTAKTNINDGWTLHDSSKNIWKRAWNYNWTFDAGAWGPGNPGDPLGHRNERIIVTKNSDGSRVRLRQEEVEKWSYYVHPDYGAASWAGQGVWNYERYIPPAEALVNENSFAVAELGSTTEDEFIDSASPGYAVGTEKKPYEFGSKGDIDNAVVYFRIPNPNYNSGAAHTKENPKYLGRVRTLKDIYVNTAGSHPSPNTIFVRLPAGLTMSQVSVETTLPNASSSGGGFKIHDKSNVILRNLVFRDGVNATGAAVNFGDTSFNWYLENDNWLVEDVTVENPSAKYGVNLSGLWKSTFRRFKITNSSRDAAHMGYSNNVRFENCQFNKNMWRFEQSSTGFGPAGFKGYMSRTITFANTQFNDNVSTSFYCDVANENYLFEDCEFKRNDVGFNFEIGKGPVTVRRSVFEDNVIGFQTLSTSNVALLNNKFINNYRYAIGLDMRTRGPGSGTDCFYWSKTSFVRGDSVLDAKSDEARTGEKYSIKNNEFTSSRGRGSRFIGMIAWGTQQDGTNQYINHILTPASNDIEGNKYYNPDNSEYLFESVPNTSLGTISDFVGVARWNQITGDTGTWDSSIAKALPAVNYPTYPTGFTWNRKTDSANFYANNAKMPWEHYDSKRQPVWSYRITNYNRNGTQNKLGAASNQWWTLPTDMIAYQHTDGKLRHMNAEYNPTIDTDKASLDFWNIDADGGIPMFEWRNPTGQQVTINPSGTLTLEWEKARATERPLDLIIFKESANGATRTPIYQNRFLNPAVNTANSKKVIDLDNLPDGNGEFAASDALTAVSDITVAAGEKIVFAFYYENSGYDWRAALYDNVTLTLNTATGSTAGPNLVSNPSFDAEAFDTQTPSGWSEWTGQNTTGAGYTESYGGSKTGARHATHYASGAYDIYTYQFKTGLVNGLYTARVWVRSGGGFYATQFETKDHGNNGSKEVRSIPTTNIYTQLEIKDINVTNGQCTIGFWSSAPSGGKWTYFDDVEFFKQ